jgi:hypothetical protein
MIDQGLLVAAFAYAMVLIGVGAVALLAVVAWAARSPLADWTQRRNAARDLRRTADALQRSSESSDTDAPLGRTPHPAH